MADGSNPIIQDRTVDFVLYDTLDAERLTKLSRFEDHSRETFDMVIDTCRRFARNVLMPTYKPMDEDGAYYKDGRVVCHPLMKELAPKIVDLGLGDGMRSVEDGGGQLPMTILMAANAYLSGANVSAMGYGQLTIGAAHLLESFGSEELKRTYMDRMWAGEWTGTMALTEPQAGSGLGDVATKGTPTDDGHYLIQGSKVFISGGDNDFSENIVHMVLGRIEGAPTGIKGLSLFCVPRLRVEGGKLVDNDCTTAGTFHKHGYRGLPSIALNFGERGDCRGWLLGEPNKGITYMFQMMNEARLGVGSAAMATAMVAYEESLQYAKDRPQGRHIGTRSSEPMVNIIEHADVRRMLLRQKAICEGAYALLSRCALYLDHAHHAEQEDARARSLELLELLMPAAKTFPSERGYESNALAVQIHGGYGYTSEYLPEAWLRDQKLNSIHEGTSGIQGMDLLGRKVLGSQGAALVLLADEIDPSLARAEEAGVDSAWTAALREALTTMQVATAAAGEIALGGDISRALQNTADYLDMFGTLVVGWCWLDMASAAKECLAADAKAGSSFYEGKLKAAQYWYANEMPRVAVLGEVVRAGDDAFFTATEAHL